MRSSAPATFADFIFHHALTRPEKPAIVLGDRVATYDMMAQGIVRVEERIRALKLVPHELVGLAIESPIRHLIAAAALFRLGHPIISATNTADIVAHKLPVTAVLQGGPESILAGMRQVVASEDWFVGERRPILARGGGFDSEDSICRVDLSSGTTGRPKALSLSIEAFHQWTVNYYTAIGLGFWDRLLCLPGLTTSWGFTMAAHVLMAGKTMLRASAARDALQMIAVYSADAMVASTQQLRELAREQARAPVFCPTLRVVMTAGGLISRQLLLEARARICSQIVVQYGSSEAGSTAYALADQIDDVEGATGFVVPGATVEVVDDDNHALPAGTEGILRVRAPWMARPYPPDIAGQADFRDGWFYPGDRGRITADGMLIVTGRASEVINSGGLKLAPDVIEDILLAHPTVADAGAFGVMGAGGIEEICVVIVPRAPLSEQHVIDWCAERNVPVARVFMAETLPKTPLGKIQRGDLKKIFVS